MGGVAGFRSVPRSNPPRGRSVRCGKRALASDPEPWPSPALGPTFPERPPWPPSVCTLGFQPRPRAGPGWGCRQSVLGPQGLGGGQEGRAGAVPGRGPSSPRRCTRAGTVPGVAGGCRRDLIGIRGRSEARTADEGFQWGAGRRGSGAPPPGGEDTRDRGRASRRRGRSWAGAPAAAPALPGGLWGRCAPRPLPPPPLLPRPPGPRSCKGISTFLLCSSPALKASVSP